MKSEDCEMMEKIVSADGKTSETNCKFLKQPCEYCIRTRECPYRDVLESDIP